MHFYSDDPARRFVVINDERVGEGAEVGTEVRVAEIRRDDVVLQFQGQSFQLPRSGF